MVYIPSPPAHAALIHTSSPLGFRSSPWNMPILWKRRNRISNHILDFKVSPRNHMGHQFYWPKKPVVTCFRLVFCCDDKCPNKSSLWENWFIWPPGPSLWGHQWRELRLQVILRPQSRAESNGHRDPSAQLAFSSPIQSRIPCLGSGATHSGWVLPSVNISVIISHKCVHRPTWFAQSLTETPFHDIQP